MCRAYNQLNTAVRAFPRCKYPVGLGGKRVMICFMDDSVIGLDGFVRLDGYGRLDRLERFERFVRLVGYERLDRFGLYMVLIVIRNMGRSFPILPFSFQP